MNKPSYEGEKNGAKRQNESSSWLTAKMLYKVLLCATVMASVWSSYSLSSFNSLHVSCMAGIQWNSLHSCRPPVLSALCIYWRSMSSPWRLLLNAFWHLQSDWNCCNHHPVSTERNAVTGLSAADANYHDKNLPRWDGRINLLSQLTVCWNVTKWCFYYGMPSKASQHYK